MTSLRRRHDAELAEINEQIRLSHKMARSAYGDVGMYGAGVFTLRGEDGKIKDIWNFYNKITDVGDEYYAKMGSQGVGPANLSFTTRATGMRLGTGGATAVTKAGAASFIVTYVTGSSVAFKTGFPTVTNLGAGLGWQVRYESDWAAGVATATGINEAVITTESPLTNVQGTAANTIARVDSTGLTPAVNKGASDTLTVTWDHKFLG